MKPHDIVTLAQDKAVACIDFKFCDIHGRWHHFTIPASRFCEELFEDGLGFDGSSIRGWQGVEASDMLVIPDPRTAFIDPFVRLPTLSLVCDIEDPITREPYSRSPRGVAVKAEQYLQSTGFADKALFGPEAEFFVFDEVRYQNTSNAASYFVDSAEGIWNTAAEEMPNLGYKIPHKQGNLPVPPMDKLMDLRNEMVVTLQEMGIEVETQHHEVATGGQCEIGLRCDTLLAISDKVCQYKYVVKNVAWRYGKCATFMPKPLFGDNGSGMHVHSSIWKGATPIMAGDGYAGLSETGLHYIGGILKHAKALCALTNPSNNSYKRLVPGYEAPVIMAYSARNRSAICRIPTYSPSPKSKRVEFRCPDSSANPYLAFSAILMAGLDGVENRIDPGEAIDKNLYDLPPEEAANLDTVPESLRLSLEALRDDHAFLLKGDVFTPDFIRNYIALKMDEYDQVRLRPHPHEYSLYFDV